MFALLDSVIDDIALEVPNQDLHVRKRVRMFLISHLYGPLLGLPIPIFLLLADPQPFPHVYILTVSILAFWLFPLLVRVLPKLYTAWVALSILNLNFAVLWSAYNYGGASSPFMIWYILVPFLVFFYLGGSRKARILIFWQIIVGICVFAVLPIDSTNTLSRLPSKSMFYTDILSTLLLIVYTSFLASYYSRMVNSQYELSIEIKKHESTLEMLTKSRENVELAKRLVEARNIQLESTKKKLEYTALHDALTALPNRHYLDDRLSEDADRCSCQDSSLALLHIDLDRFKQINDTLGHSAGDFMLVHVAHLLKASVPKSDFIARIGGDEFVIVHRSDGNTQTITQLAEHIIELIRQPVPYQSHLCRFGASIGIALESGADVDPRRLLVNSDMALYRAKARGRNRVEFFSKELQAQVVQTKRIADDILRGLELGEFVANYQPQYDAKSFKMVGVEGLVRWNHPTEGVLMPASFLGIADELNVVALIDQMVLHQALADFERWNAAGLEVPKVSVNVSSKRLNDKELISSLKALSIRPGTFSLELVEVIFLDEIDEIVEWNIAEIKELGIDIEIDDFGTGHASIVGLLKLRPKRLKIDRQFVTPLLDAPENSKLVASIVEIGKSLGIEVVAEGVETMEQAHLLRELGCDVLQGFAFARPMTASEIEHFLEGAPSAQFG